MTDLITPRELAQKWGVTEQHLANMRNLGKHPYLKIRGRVFYSADEIAKLEAPETHNGHTAQ